LLGLEAQLWIDSLSARTDATSTTYSFLWLGLFLSVHLCWLCAGAGAGGQGTWLWHLACGLWNLSLPTVHV
jgi:hypothetical protein